MDNNKSEWGWKLHHVKFINSNGYITLDNGISYGSPCFTEAKEGDLWAVLHEPCGSFVFGMVKRAIKIEEGSRDELTSYSNALNLVDEILTKAFIDKHTDSYHYPKERKVIQWLRKYLEDTRRNKEENLHIPSEEIANVKLERGECKSCTGTADPQVFLKNDNRGLCIECARNIANPEEN